MFTSIQKWHANFSARERIGRWDYFLTSFVVGFVYLLVAVFGAMWLGRNEPESALFMTLVVLIVLAMVASGLYVQLSLLVKRFHDFDASGWWTVLLVVLQAIPVVGFVAWVAVMLIPSTTGNNRFGPQPNSI